MNLTAITDPKGVAIKHMADSLSCYDPAISKMAPASLTWEPVPAFPACPCSFTGRI